MLVDQIVVGAMGDYDTPCFQRETDIVVPAYVDHLTLNVTVIKSSDRQYLVRCIRTSGLYKYSEMLLS